MDPTTSVVPGPSKPTQDEPEKKPGSKRGLRRGRYKHRRDWSRLPTGKVLLQKLGYYTDDPSKAKTMVEMIREAFPEQASDEAIIRQGRNVLIKREVTELKRVLKQEFSPEMSAWWLENRSQDIILKDVQRLGVLLPEHILDARLAYAAHLSSMASDSDASTTSKKKKYKILPPVSFG